MVQKILLSLSCKIFIPTILFFLKGKCKEKGN